MYDLIKKADVFVENIAPGSADRNGFGWDKLHELNPKLIYASLKGFNQGSRFENVKAFEPVAQSAGGAASAALSGDVQHLLQLYQQESYQTGLFFCRV